MQDTRSFMNDLQIKNRRVLVVDDNRAVHDDFRKILCPDTAASLALDAAEMRIFGNSTTANRGDRFEVDSAYQGSEGVLAVAKAIEAGLPYAMAFVDMRMPPGLDGVETTQGIWAIDSEIQIVLCTAYSADSWGEMLEKIGNNDRMVILRKPFDGVEAHQLARALTEKWQLSRQSRRKMKDLESMVADRTRELRRTNETLQMQACVLEAAANAIVVTERTGVIEWVNPAFTALTGYTAAEAIGQQPSTLLRSGQHDSAFYKKMWGDILAGKVWNGEVVNRRKDGSLYTEEMTITPVKGENGGITHFIAIKQDVTQKKQLEEQLRQAHKMEAVGQLAGGVAHDYNNILAASMLQLGMLLDQPDLAPDFREVLESLQKGEERAANLNRQLLMFSRRQAVHLKPVELNALVEEQLKMLRRLLGEHIELIVHTPSRDIWIEADPGMIELAIMNLCINARDAMPDGGRLSVGVRPVESGVDGWTSQGERPGKFVCLSVTDTGIGMNPQTQRRIFEPFFTTKALGKGTGLGLATVYGIVKQHKGWIECTSQLGHGAEFRVCLPSRPQLNAGPAAESTARITRGTETILVVEDEESVRTVVSTCLKVAGYQVLNAANGPEALQVWHEKADQIDLLLTDMIMPGGMTGLELAETCLKSKPALPVILTSGYSPDSMRPCIPERPGIAYLCKPCDASCLTDVVRKSLDRLGRAGGTPSEAPLPETASGTVTLSESLESSAWVSILPAK